ncbi:TIGR02611 family protein [Mycobacterium sp. SMC-4]|uniref:TIGR02611 family protein n=1 Tax=Mycobacterium sp. SMC-4 TaxID=2857059 RepID=UPI0021B33811|nr:TIGR02611 family protein [Mycobacterium sp. SMC-4]UXA20130.1 TIGR02611 family protein [Mycobacterium sp. SMC-4]
MSSPDGPGVARRWARWRDRLRKRRAVDLGYRITIGVVGTVVVVIGIVAIPFPGPGWPIVFVGLGILATEFDWARRLLAYARVRYDAVMAWFKSQGVWVQIAGALFTAVVVVVTVWFLGAVAFLARLVNIEHPWLNSPIGLGS